MNESTAALEMLWEGLQRLPSLSPASVDAAPKRPLSRQQLLDDIPTYMAGLWTIRHAIPASQVELQEALDGSELPEKYRAWLLKALLEAYRSAQGLAALSDDDWGWRLMSPSDRETWPQNGQDVFYFFDVMGTHLGKFNGAQEGSPEDTLTGDAGFSGACGFLDAYSVACWAPRPLQ